jgi:hypothetical protein
MVGCTQGKSEGTEKKLGKKKQGEEMKIDKRKVKIVLDFLSLIPPEEIRKEDNTIDFRKLETRIDVQEAVRKLKEMGVTKEYLFKHFLLAGWILNGLMDK